MKIDVTQALAVLDGLLAAAEAFVPMTPTTRDDEWVAFVRSYREKFRPFFGASETGGTEDLPQATADAIDRVMAQFELVHSES